MPAWRPTRGDGCRGKRPRRSLGAAPRRCTRAVRAGSLVRRTGRPRGVPSLELKSVEAWAAALAAERARTVAKRAERDARRVRPPDDTEVWLTGPTVAIMLGISTTRVSQLARAGKLPSTRVGPPPMVQADAHRADRGGAGASGQSNAIGRKRVEVARRLPVRPPVHVALPRACTWARSSATTPPSTGADPEDCFEATEERVVKRVWVEEDSPSEQKTETGRR